MSIEAQKHFNRGLAHAYGFNFDEAQFEFLTALHEDPDCAMCHWGLAYCGGANINEREKKWRGREESAARAVKLAKDPLERAFANALVVRYRDGDKAYANAMHAILQANPDDADAAILYTEAVMLTYPLGSVWWPRGAPLANIVDARHMLERVLARDPNHIGAIHFYIHLMEVSRDFRVALPYADKLATLAPGAGHLIHMASHLYLKVGRYADAEDINKQAIKADDALVRMMLPSSVYTGFTMHPHHFLWETRMWLGNHAGARETTHHMHRHIHAEHDELGYAATFEAFTAIRFGDWTSALAIPVPAKPLGAFAVHLARGFAFAAKQDFDEANKELALVSLDAAPQMWRPRLIPVAEAARAQLAGAIAFAAGDTDKAIAELERAVELEDKMDNPMEPPLWVFPARQRLGAVLLEVGRARDAIAVYRKDLARNPQNGWSLFGLAAALEALKDPGAVEAWKQFKTAWARSDVKLTASVVF